MIVCPVTLIKVCSTSLLQPSTGVELMVPPDVQNWAAEIKKWLGRDSVRIMVADQPSSVKTFANSRTYQILIVGYEKVSLTLVY